MDSITATVTVLIVAILVIPVTVALITMTVVSRRRIDADVSPRKRLTHSETAAVEDAIVTAEALAVQIGAILHILRRGPYAYPDDLPAGALWRAVAEALEREGHLVTPNGSGKRGDKGTSSTIGGHRREPQPDAAEAHNRDRPQA